MSTPEENKRAWFTILLNYAAGRTIAELKALCDEQPEPERQVWLSALAQHCVERGCK